MAPSAPESFDPTKTPLTPSVSETDRKLINEIRSKLSAELKLVPGYDDDRIILRWLVGWDRKLDEIIPKLRKTLIVLYALGLPHQDFSSVEKITSYCDAISKPATYLPGSLIGLDKIGNVVSLQVVGHLDGEGLMKSTMISDLYISRIAESEGVMNLIRENEKKDGRQLGTVLIIDLDGLSKENVTITSLKVINTMLVQLQEMFPDVLRKVFVIRAPGFIQTAWLFISSVLARQTQQKIEFLGTNWRERLKESIDESILFEHWGGSRKADTPFGNVRMGGLVPKSLYYSPENIPTDLKRINVSARNRVFVPVDVHNEDLFLRWWWQSDDGDLDFWVIYLSEDGEERIVWPRFRLLTQFVPEVRRISVPYAGTYRLYFDNSHSRLFSKTILYNCL